MARSDDERLPARAGGRPAPGGAIAGVGGAGRDGAVGRGGGGARGGLGRPRGGRGRLRLRDRLFTVLCVLAALVVVLLALSRGNPRAAAIGGGLFLGYAVLHSVVRRLEPTARLVTGLEADTAERLAQFRATRAAGQVAVGVALVGVAFALFGGWDTGLWVAGTAILVVASFVVGLWWFSRAHVS